jgi:hypothetical protein
MKAVTPDPKGKNLLHGREMGAEITKNTPKLQGIAQ